MRKRFMYSCVIRSWGFNFRVKGYILLVVADVVVQREVRSVRARVILVVS
jgi:hypothetical protein